MKPLYPIFAEAAEYTLDEYWRGILLECSRGNFPKNLKYSPNSNQLYVTRADKKTETHILTNDETEVFQIMIHVLRNLLHMKSTRDIETESGEIDKIREQRVQKNGDIWKKKTNGEKEQSIELFVSKLCKEYSLTPKERKHVLSVINVGLQFKRILPDNFELSSENSNTILKIPGLKFNSDKRFFYTEGVTKIENKSNTTVEKIYGDIERWGKEMKKNL